MGTVIKAKRDGFRRAGLVHLAAGTFYPDGELSESQLVVFRAEPQLLVVEGVQEDALQSDSEEHADLIQAMEEIITSLRQQLKNADSSIESLEHSLENARAGLRAATGDLVALLDRQKGVPALVLSEAQALEPADPKTEGVLCIAQYALFSIISHHLQPVQASPEAQSDGNEPPLTHSVGLEAPPSAPPVAPVPPSTGAEPQPVAHAKASTKRGTAGKGDKEGAYK